MEKRKYIFGPVPSRRLGLSLGIDTIPFKTCSYNCIYCQLGKTTCLTAEIKEYFPLDEILNEIKTCLKQKINANYITLSGSGEPTLYSRIAELIDSIKTITNIPIAILTNGSLLFKKEVAESLQDADLVLPSLDAGSVELFKYINRPHKSIHFDEMVDGIRSFTHHFKKEVWLEVFLVNGVNTLDTDVLKLKSLIEKIKPHRVQLNTSIRPTAEDYAFQVKSEKMISIVKLLGNNVEIIAEYDNSFKQTNFKATAEDIIAMLKRRPCTIDNISSSLGIHRNEAIKYLNELEKGGLINHRKKGFNYLYFAEKED